MIEDQFFEVIDPVLAKLGSRIEDGEEFRSPPLDVLRYYRRDVAMHRVPVVGRAQSIVAVARQPVDVGLAGTRGDYKTLMARLAMAANGRFPPGRKHGLGGIALTAVILTPEPIAGSDDSALEAAFSGVSLGRSRCVPLGIIRLNLGQEAMSFRVAGGPGGMWPEPVALADALSARFRRFVPLFEGE